MSFTDYATEYREKFFASDREMRQDTARGLYNRTGSDRDNIEADDRREAQLFQLTTNLPSIPNGGTSLLDEEEPDGLKLRYLSSRDLNVYKTHLVEPAKLANSDDEYRLRTRPIISRPRDLPRIDDKFLLVNYSTRDLPTNKQNMVTNFDRDMAYPKLLDRQRELPNIDAVSYASTKLSHVPFDATNYVSDWTRGGRNSRR